MRKVMKVTLLGWGFILGTFKGQYLVLEEPKGQKKTDNLGTGAKIQWNDIRLSYFRLGL